MDVNSRRSLRHRDSGSGFLSLQILKSMGDQGARGRLVGEARSRRPEYPDCAARSNFSGKHTRR
jgi:hypothetical protein